MPVYEFMCPACGVWGEEIVKVGTKTIKCPACGTDMDRMMSPTNFHLAGHSWYRDGYGLHTKKGKGGKKDAK